MTVLVFFKILSDIGFYLTFAGLVSLLLGGNGGFLLLSAFVISAAVALSYLLSGKGALRLLPLLITAVCPLLPGANAISLLFLLPPVLYCLVVCLKCYYVPEHGRQTDIFRLFWKIFLFFDFICLLAGWIDHLSGFVIPCGMVTLSAMVLLTRSLRHDREVYSTKGYQLVNLCLVGTVGLVGIFLSSGLFLGAVTAVFGAVYRYIVTPVFMLVIYMIIGVLQGLGWLFSFIKFGKPETNEVEINTSGFGDVIEALGGEEMNQSDVFRTVLTGLAIVLGIVVVILLFRFLFRRHGSVETSVRTRDVRQSVKAQVRAEAREDRGTPVAGVRNQYRKFLRLCRGEGIEIRPDNTSADVEYYASKVLPGEGTGELREIYIEARYNGSATKEGALRAQQLVSSLKKSVKD